MAGFLTSSSVSLDNGSNVVNVTGSVDCSFVVSGTAVYINDMLMEGVSGTASDPSGNSTITLRNIYTGTAIVGGTLVAFNTIEGLRDTIQRARELSSQFQDGSSKIGEIDSTLYRFLTAITPLETIELDAGTFNIEPYEYLRSRTLKLETQITKWEQNLYPDWISDAGAGVPFSYQKGMIVNYAGQYWVSNEDANQGQPSSSVKWNSYNPVQALQDLSGLTEPSDLDSVHTRTFSSVTAMVEYTSHVLDNIVCVAGINGYDFYKTVNGEIANDHNILEVGYGSLQLKRIEHSQNPSAQGFGLGFGRQFIQRINGRVDDVYLLIQGDSTGVNTDRWPYLTAIKLAALYPTHSVKFLFWNDSIKGYDPTITLSTGTGSQTIYIYNCSRSGGSIPINTGDRHDAVYAGETFDLIIMNYGHNNQIGNGGLPVSIRRNNLLYRNIEVVAQVIQDQPQAEIALTLQNTDQDYPEFTIDQCEAVDRTARLLGCSTIDVRSAFLWKRDFSPPITDWYLDGVHPNPIGQGVWSDIVINGLVNPVKQQLTTLNPLATLTDNVRNPFLTYWDADTDKPFYSELQGAAQVAKNATTFETNGSSMQLATTNGTKAWIEWDVSDFLASSTHEGGVTFAARIFVPAATLDARAGQVQISASNGALLGSEYIAAEVRNRWVWRTVHLDRKYADLKYATSLKLMVNSSYTNGELIYIDRISVIDGLLPSQPKMKSEFVPDYYYFKNTVGLSGSLLLYPSARTVRMATEGVVTSGFVISANGLILGETYRLTWSNDDSVTGVASVRASLDSNDTAITSADFSPATSIDFTATNTGHAILFAAANGQGIWNISGLSITQV